LRGVATPPDAKICADFGKLFAGQDTGSQADLIRCRLDLLYTDEDCSLSAPFSERINELLSRIAGKLDEALPESAEVPGRLHEAMRYSVLNGGKRVRPLLVYATGECLQIDPDCLDAPAIAIELIHAFSLVHDDLPAMDNDDLRRGHPTVHRKFDEATAILAADALQPLAFQVLASTSGISAEQRNRLVETVARACGSLGMTGGQSIDLMSEGLSLSESELEQMYALKTGALIEAAVMGPSHLADQLSEQKRDALHGFSRRIGVAFQIKDDILDVEGETDVIGKQAGADQRLGKATFPSLFGVEAARLRCEALLEAGLQQLDVFEGDAEPLRWIARYIVDRGI
jgi:geranylgeranyl pyrophosphate synthase